MTLCISKFKRIPTTTLHDLDGWMDGWMDGCMDGWMDGWMDISLNYAIITFLLDLAA